MKFAFATIFLILTICQGLNVRIAARPRIINEVMEMLRGTFEAWRANKEEVNELLECVDGIEEIKTQIEEIIEEIKHLNPLDIKKIADLLMRLIDSVQKILSDVGHCYKSETELYNIVMRVISLTPLQLITKILGNIRVNGGQIWGDIMGLIDAAKKGSYYQIGFCFGDAIDLLFLKLKPINTLRQ